jgi:hypothetical protein
MERTTGKRTYQRGSNRRLKGFQKKGLHNLKPSRDNGAINVRTMRWDGHVASMRGKIHTKYWSVNLKGKDHFEGVGVTGYH